MKSPVVQVESGSLAGEWNADQTVCVFKGVPYARPPVGPLRWRPPQPPEHWSGIRPADTFGPRCVQPNRPPHAVGYFGPEPESEDCLYLNVWTAAPTRGEQRPVMLWLHGGAFLVGSGSLPIFGGAGLAKRGAVVVTINYRLGRLGFLAHPGLSAEQPHRSSRQLRPARSDRGVAVGAGQHRGVRRRPEPGDDFRPVCRLVERQLADGLAAGQGLVPPCDRTERRRVLRNHHGAARRGRAGRREICARARRGHDRRIARQAGPRAAIPAARRKRNLEGGLRRVGARRDRPGQCVAGDRRLRPPRQRDERLRARRAARRSAHHRRDRRRGLDPARDFVGCRARAARPRGLR